MLKVTIVEGPADEVKDVLQQMGVTRPEVAKVAREVKKPDAGKNGAEHVGIRQEESVWGKLSVLNPARGSKPKEFKTPQGFVLITSWKQVLPLLVKWLTEHHYLDRMSFPIVLSNSPKSALVAKTPVHPDGRKMGVPVQVGNLWVETRHGAPETAKHARNLMKVAGVSLDKIEIWQ